MDKAATERMANQKNSEIQAGFSQLFDFEEAKTEYFNSLRWNDTKNVMSMDNLPSAAQDFFENFVSLRLFSWNFDWNKHRPDELVEEKIELIKKFRPNILVLQECSYYDCLRLKSEFKNAVWYGDGKDSTLGIGMFSDTWSLELSPCHSYNVPFRYVVPYSVKKEGVQFTIFSVWTKDCINKELSDGKKYYDEFHNLTYAGNIEKAIDYYKSLLKEPVLFIGDFNSADTQQKRSLEHLRVIEKLAAYNIYNCAKLPGCYYDKDFEFFPTYYQNYDNNKGYVDDYCFISDNADIINIDDINFGKPEKWLKYSDHIPLMLNVHYRAKYPAK